MTTSIGQGRLGLTRQETVLSPRSQSIADETARHALFSLTPPIPQYPIPQLTDLQVHRSPQVQPDRNPQVQTDFSVFPPPLELIRQQAVYLPTDEIREDIEARRNQHNLPLWEDSYNIRLLNENFSSLDNAISDSDTSPESSPRPILQIEENSDDEDDFNCDRMIHVSQGGNTISASIHAVAEAFRTIYQNRGQNMSMWEIEREILVYIRSQND